MSGSMVIQMEFVLTTLAMDPPTIAQLHNCTHNCTIALTIALTHRAPAQRSA